MLLTIDVGNTHTVIGVWQRTGDNTEQRATSEETNANGNKCAFPWRKLCGWRLTTIKSYTADEIVIQISTLLSAQNIPTQNAPARNIPTQITPKQTTPAQDNSAQNAPEQNTSEQSATSQNLPAQTAPTQNISAENITGAVMCSVVPRLTASWSAALQSMIGVDVQLCTADAMGSAFACSYPYPHEIGMDYIADALAAVHLYGAPVVVFDFGTATNISIIDNTGTFKGGIIAPGVEAGASALFSKATQLTSVALRAPEHVVGQSTDECIRSGIVLGEAARVDGLVAMICEEMGYPCKVIATGGLSAAVGRYSKTITEVNPDLTLQGLCVAYDQLKG